MLEAPDPRGPCLCCLFQSPDAMPIGAMALWVHMALLHMPLLPSPVEVPTRVEAPDPCGPCLCCRFQRPDLMPHRAVALWVHMALLHMPLHPSPVEVPTTSEAPRSRGQYLHYFAWLPPLPKTVEVSPAIEASRSCGSSEHHLAWSAGHAAACPEEPGARVDDSHDPEASLPAPQPGFFSRSSFVCTCEQPHPSSYVAFQIERGLSNLRRETA